jgi:hypothetical protein
MVGQFGFAANGLLDRLMDGNNQALTRIHQIISIESGRSRCDADELKGAQAEQQLAGFADCVLLAAQFVTKRYVCDHNQQ